MGNLSSRYVQQFKRRNEPKQQDFITTYKIDGKDYDVPSWSHPASLANDVLDWIRHTYFYGIQVVAPPGNGKTTIATVIAHHLHKKNPDFKIRWAGGAEFTHQKQFFASLPKHPHIIIFDDISSALKQLSEREVEANFEALTTVRWILDPTKGKIPVIIITTFHYSKKLEKAIRAQLGTTIFASFGNEEKTNIDTIAGKGTKARMSLDYFSGLYERIFTEHNFWLTLPSGREIHYKTDEPFRPCCAVSNTKGKVIVYSDRDMCNVCAKKRIRKFVDPQLIFDQVKKAYGIYGVQALRHALFKRGYEIALHPEAARAMHYVENKALTTLETDFDKLIEVIYKEAKKKMPTKLYHKRQQENKLYQELEDNAEIISSEVDTNMLGSPQNV